MIAVSGGFNQHGVSLVDLSSRKVAQFIPLKETWNGLAFSRDGSLLASGSYDRTVQVRDAATGELVQTLRADRGDEIGEREEGFEDRGNPGEEQRNRESRRGDVAGRAVHPGKLESRRHDEHGGEDQPGDDDGDRLPQGC